MGCRSYVASFEDSFQIIAKSCVQFSIASVNNIMQNKGLFSGDFSGVDKGLPE